MALIFAVLGVLLAWRPRDRLRWEIGYFVLAGVVATLLTLQIAAPLWELPWHRRLAAIGAVPLRRWLVLTALCVSVLAGLVPHAATYERQTAALAATAGAGGGGDSRPYAYLQVQISEPAEGPVSLAGLMSLSAVLR